MYYSRLVDKRLHVVASTGDIEKIKEVLDKGRNQFGYFGQKYSVSFFPNPPASQLYLLTPIV